MSWLLVFALGVYVFVLRCKVSALSRLCDQLTEISADLSETLEQLEATQE